jgi:hypothetical protein
MSDAHDEHESAIKTPKQLIVAILAGFLVPIIAIVLLVQYVANDKKVGAGSSAQTPEAIAARIHPVADQGFTFKDNTALNNYSQAKPSIKWFAPHVMTLVRLVRQNLPMLQPGRHVLLRVTIQC